MRVVVGRQEASAINGPRAIRHDKHCTLFCHDELRQPCSTQYKSRVDLSTAPTMEEQRAPKAFSCIRCFDRKVKCDKQSPCSNCIKSNVECIFRVPPAPRRRKKKTQEDILLARLKKCEELLKSNGIEVDGPDTLARTTSSPTKPDSPPLTQTNSNSQRDSPNVSSGTGMVYDAPSFASPEIRRSGRLITDHGKSRFVENNLWASLSDEVCHLETHCCVFAIFGSRFVL